ncbi:MAG: L,D-transpeptidase [Nostocaceae cyanobacterium]|nr:L,D-transpeptidase [Nostocaceae cyanobacterium]
MANRFTWNLTKNGVLSVGVLLWCCSFGTLIDRSAGKAIALDPPVNQQVIPNNSQNQLPPNVSPPNQQQSPKKTPLYRPLPTAGRYLQQFLLKNPGNQLPPATIPANPPNSENESPPVVNPPSDVPEATPPADSIIQEIRLVVKRKERRVFVYQGEQVIASYRIAVGKTGWETPVGEFRVINMEKNPIFKSFKTGRIVQPGPENPLGPRWIGIWTDGKTQLGFHGTNQEELIGKAVSHGCIRMRNRDVLKLFDKVKIGTPVMIHP